MKRLTLLFLFLLAVHGVAVERAFGPITATSLNGLTISTSSGTITIANGKTLTSSNTLTLAGTDGSTLNIGAGGSLGSAAFTAATAYAPATSGAAILYGNGSGGFSSVTIGSGLSFSAGTLSATGGSGTVTSVSLTMPTAVFVSPVSGSGGTTAVSLAPALATQSANTVFAGPSTGSAATPTFRALVAGDIPDLSGTYQAAGSYQPLDGDLTALAALGGTHTLYYRSAANTWSAVTIGSGLSFTGATLDVGDLSGTYQVAGSYQPLDGDLTAIAALSGTHTLYYRSAANTWSAVTVGAGLTFSGATLDVGDLSSTYQVAGSYLTASNTATLTGKTFDSQATGNVLKLLDEIHLTHPHQADGTGATINTTANAATYGHATFSGSADQAGNYVIYRLRVPFDLDTGTDLAASLTFRLGGSDTGKHRYVISMADVADSAGADSPTFSNAINLDFAGDASGASGDDETVSYTTLTSWRSSLTAGHIWVIKLARDADDGTNDTSSVGSSDVELAIKFGRTQ